MTTKNAGPRKKGAGVSQAAVRDQKEIPTRMPKFWQLSIE